MELERNNDLDYPKGSMEKEFLDFLEKNEEFKNQEAVEVAPFVSEIRDVYFLMKHADVV